MRAYSQDLRDRALQALGRGESLASISRRLEVSRQWVCDVRDRMVLHGERGPQRVGGHRRSRVESLQTELRSWLQADPGLTLQPMCARLAERHQVEIKSPALWHQLNRWGLSLKKALHASEQERPDVQQARREWQAGQSQIDPSRLVFLDETSASTQMTRRYGGSDKGQRCVSAVPHGHWKTTTFLAGLRHNSLTAPLVVDGPMDGATFLAYIRDFLCPTLRPGDIVIADNLSSHKVAGVREAVESAGAELRYLPPYSPDLNPIEKLFSKLKTLLRKAALRTVDDLWKHIGQLIDAFPAAECANYLASCGYVRS